MAKYEFYDLVSPRMVDRCQRLFVRSVGYDVLFIDEDGRFVTKRERERYGHYRTKEEIFQRCIERNHFVAPILAKGEEVGYLILGNVVSPQFSEQNAESLAIMTAEIMSEIAEGKVLSIEAAEEISRAANMKTDFLANMSHEIRTPMNAVIGMAEMALREDLSPKARDYVAQIKSSGNALLAIINDILDFSKIDSGKMEIIPVEYEPAALIHEVVNVCMTRLKDKEVELLVDYNPQIPKMLVGDNIRVRQILINLANNAIKFTKKGSVTIKVDYEKDAVDQIRLKIGVTDTGIGIKEQDLNHLFQSFQQVDSKRNRNIEGTGLGLAISKQLTSLMNGSIHVDSVYGEGSTFSFDIEQKVADWTPSLSIRHVDRVAVIGYFTELIWARDFFKDASKLDVYSIALPAADTYDDIMKNYVEIVADKKMYFFFEEKDYREDVIKILDENPMITAIMMVDFYSNRKSDRKNLKIMTKPFSTIKMASVLSGDETLMQSEQNEAIEFNFTAPNAEILVVDDNEINLTVTQGLLEPLNMHVDTALGGKVCLSMIDKKRYDIIFMDHMMPEIDGVETTRIIRRLHPSYNDIPIIALTANAVGDVKEMFMQEGMNDFVAKPIELNSLVSMIRKWLPEEKIFKAAKEEAVESVSNPNSINENGVDLNTVTIGDLDLEGARKMLNNDRIFWKLLKGYYAGIQEKSARIKELMDAEAYDVYTIEVHALKSLSRQIGATKLAAMAEALEKAGNAKNISAIQRDTDAMLQKYISYYEVLQPYCEEKEAVDDGSKANIDKDVLLTLFDQMAEAVENLDMDGMEETVNELNKYQYSDDEKTLLKELIVAVGNMDVDECEAILGKWKALV